MKHISIDKLTFKYNDKTIFRDFSMEFPANSFSVIMSPSGSGKTTLLFLIAGLLSPSSGSISYPLDRPKFSMVFQDDRLIESLNVINNIKLVNPQLSDTDILKTLTSLMIDDTAFKKVSSLSGGERKRVAIARALLNDYDILLLDEPFTGMDDKTKLRVIEYIKKRTAHKTVLMVTHHESEASLCGDHIFNSFPASCLT